MKSGQTVRIELEEGRSDTAGLRAVYASEFPSLVRLATALLGSVALGEEIVQDTFARMLERPPRLVATAKLPAYVRTAVLNACRSKVRRLILERRHAKTAVPTAKQPGPDHELRKALLCLPMRQRQCVALRFYDDMTVDQIAELLDISAGSVKTHLHRGLQKLREELGEHD